MRYNTKKNNIDNLSINKTIIEKGILSLEGMLNQKKGQSILTPAWSLLFIFFTDLKYTLSYFHRDRIFRTHIRAVSTVYFVCLPVFQKLSSFHM